MRWNNIIYLLLGQAIQSATLIGSYDRVTTITAQTLPVTIVTNLILCNYVSNCNAALLDMWVYVWVCVIIVVTAVTPTPFYNIKCNNINSFLSYLLSIGKCQFNTHFICSFLYRKKFICAKILLFKEISFCSIIHCNVIKNSHICYQNTRILKFKINEIYIIEIFINKVRRNVFIRQWKTH